MSGFSVTRDTASRSHVHSLAVLGSLVLCAGGMACAPDTVTVRSYPNFAPHAITNVAIAPFRASERTRGVAPAFRPTQPDLDDAGIRRSLGGPVLSSPGRARVTPVSIPTFVPESIRHMVYAWLTRHSHVQVSLTDTMSYAPQGNREGTGDHDAQSPEQQPAVGAVLDGVVHVYRERDGTTFAAIAAAVGFELRLRDVRDGSVLWVGEYFEEQKPLTQDLEGFFERGGVFVTAEDLARDGVVHVLERLPLGKE